MLAPANYFTTKTEPKINTQPVKTHREKKQKNNFHAEKDNYYLCR